MKLLKIFSEIILKYTPKTEYNIKIVIYILRPTAVFPILYPINGKDI